MAISVTQPGELDAKFARDAWLRALAKTAAIGEQGITLPALIERLAVEFDAAPALLSTEASMSYRQLGIRCNQYSRWGIAHGLKGGDTVALLMTNCAEYPAVWLGLTRIGVVVALINSQLAGEVLAHSIKIADPKYLIVGASLAPRVAAILPRLPAGMACRVFGSSLELGSSLEFGSSPEFAPLEPELALLPGDALRPAECAAGSIDATALYIYTSGTTGLPKAAKISHYRLMQWSHWFAGMLDTQPTDRMFNCLPLYHSVGGVVATFATLVNGGAVVIRPRFSASDFWRDVRDERCTLFQYIGELCRYLVNTPYQPIESEHSLRIACGNGLRPEVWLPFQTRFKIPRILEYYASTEGNFSLYNCEGQPGAIGRIPGFLANRLPVALLRFDTDKSEPWRNADGFCERCAPNEVGEAVGLMPDSDSGRAGRFEGYADLEASNRKVLRDVFRDGDSWYRTGDLMRRDERGFYYFVDRVGETYRWKGENVSTAEVLTALTASRGVLDGVVYGVSVPGADGRAGIAALVVNADFELAAFRAEVASRLPPYARPVFVRLLPALEATGTFKPRKQDLVQAGFDPERIKDPLYFDDVPAQRYVPLDAELFAAITSGTVRI
ncbi:MAG TPA: long-chain-acyl-CoA synthetase [Steroidobacteraceae bacterium]|nr:long-chain-acyl-CoA synthetase [Steroidobacteraceae bacterium]